MTQRAYADVRKTSDRGPKEFKSRVVEKEGNIMTIANRDVLTVSPTTPIRDVAKWMQKFHYRRIPVTDAGTQRLEGVAVAIDMVDFLGGGEKYNIITNDYGGNFLSAINCPIRKIMAYDYPSLTKQSSIEDAVRLIADKHYGGIPIVDGGDDGKVCGIVTENDLLPAMGSWGMMIGDVMSKDIISSSLGMMISDVAKVMVRNRKRRLPVIQEDEVIGIITVFDILEFLSKGEFKSIMAEDVLSTRVEEIMKEDVIKITTDRDLGDVLALIKERGYGGFPVVDDDNRLMGMVTITDVIKAAYRRV
ncbi:MAG: hypothetical protein A7316_10510 [Candidatus Altiarchaeales archaeon WOR_SM1_86-2]|nr:MAG: hypothetical protein A7316_10510 [Candidatus Altiarchaeales archaeon WOR_SM1_86-2]ODS40179.1 MAG: hypothetical protein A7315_09330 [Candidatus Altiarchaeales archaeon WOR_SM1_79]